MGTPYTEVTDLFLKKIETDAEFFVYDGISEKETMELINFRCEELLNEAVDNVQSEILEEHGVDFSEDRDDDLQEFTFRLNKMEKEMLAQTMEYYYYRRKKSKLSSLCNYGGKYSFSPANERKSYITFLDDVLGDVNKTIDKYNTKVRGTGEVIY